MKIPSHARYNYCLKKAYDFLDQYLIKAFPVNPFDLIHNGKCGLANYSEIAENVSCSIDDIIASLNSTDATTILKNNYYSIAYNEANLSTRIRFTLMHEIGHIFLNHLIDFEETEMIKQSGEFSTCLSEQSNQVLENEANAFARNILAPAPIVMTLNDKSVENIAHVFGISKSAAKTRIDFLETDMRMTEELNLSEQAFHIQQRYINKRKCTVCGAQFFNDYNYCPICGNKNTLKWGDGNMIYKEFETYTSKKLIRCPICQNEQTNIRGEYFQICGSYLVNRCTGDCNHIGNCSYNTILPTNARYCPISGNKSTFYNQGFLPDWDQELHSPNSNPESNEQLALEPPEDPFGELPDFDRIPEELFNQSY